MQRTAYDTIGLVMDLLTSPTLPTHPTTQSVQLSRPAALHISHVHHARNFPCVFTPTRPGRGVEDHHRQRQQGDWQLGDQLQSETFADTR